MDWPGSAEAGDRPRAAPVEVGRRRRRPHPYLHRPVEEVDRALADAWDAFASALSDADRRRLRRNPDRVRRKGEVEWADSFGGWKRDKSGKHVQRSPTASTHSAMEDDTVMPEPKEVDMTALTERERDAVYFRAAGLTPREIGRELRVAHITASRDLRSAARKLGFHRIVPSGASSERSDTA